MEEEENEEEEEDLNDIPLFEDTSDVTVELSNHNESSLVPTESASAPPTSSILAQGSDLRTDLQEEEEIMKFFRMDVDVVMIVINSLVSHTYVH